MFVEKLFSENDVKKFVEAHVDLQLGCYFSETLKLPSGTLCLSEHIDDYYWNTFSNINGQNAEVVVTEANKLFKKHKRNSAFYLDHSCRPESMSEYLKAHNFVFEKEIWMVANNLKSLKSEKIKVRPINVNDKDSFLKVFSTSFGGPSTSADGYGDIPTSYLNALAMSISRKASDYPKHIHFIAEVDNVPVGCGSIHIGDEYAGLYNVGTIPDFRKKGVGSAVSSSAIEMARLHGVKNIFFQTQPGGSVQRFYEKLGCEIIFEAELYHK